MLKSVTFVCVFAVMRKQNKPAKAGPRTHTPNKR